MNVAGSLSGPHTAGRMFAPSAEIIKGLPVVSAVGLKAAVTDGKN